jgi:DNA modification methylase
MSELYLGDCLKIMPRIASASVDMVLCDLPYGTTYAPWDCPIDLGALWLTWDRILRLNAPVVLTSSQPFTSALVMSNPHQFCCEWIWDKVNAANFANAKKQPLKTHESVLVFSKKQPRYNPQKVLGAKNHVQGKSKVNRSETRLISSRVEDDLSGMKYPKSIQVFAKHSSQCGFHPTQKPVALMEYLIKTYTNQGDTVLDNTMGSGTTGVACASTGRSFIGIEQDESYFKIAQERIWEAEMANI